MMLQDHQRRAQAEQRGDGELENLPEIDVAHGSRSCWRNSQKLLAKDATTREEREEQPQLPITAFFVSSRSLRDLREELFQLLDA
jgi:hypothetical protein